MAEKEDRLSPLPDFLLHEIISRIKVTVMDDNYCPPKEEERLMTTKEVIKTTATIAKRWRYLWTKLPNLIFINYYDGGYKDDFACIDKTLSQCPTDVNLNKFKLKFVCSTSPTSQVNRWIRYAITRNVQEVYLWCFNNKTGEEFSYYDELFFNNSCITRMKLFYCVFNPPNGTVRWDKLTFLCIEYGKLVGDSIGKILSGSPCLETLELYCCYGVGQINVTSKRFKNLVLDNYGSKYRHDIGEYIDTIEINAPSMLSLTIIRKFCLENLLLRNVSSLVKADFNYLSSNHFARKLGRTRDDIEEDLLRGILSRLGHVNDITLGDYNCLQALSRLKKKGFQLFRAGADGDEDRITELIDSGWEKVNAAYAAKIKTVEKVETGEYDDDMGFSLFD